MAVAKVRKPRSSLLNPPLGINRVRTPRDTPVLRDPDPDQIDITTQRVSNKLNSLGRLTIHQLAK